MERGALTGETPDFELFPCDAVLDACAEGLGSGLFSGKAGGETLGGSGFGAAIGDFLFGKHAVKESLAEALDGARNARHLNQIDSGPHEHEAKVAQGEIFRTGARGFGLKVRAGSSDGASVYEIAEATGLRNDWNLSLTAQCSEDAPRTVRFLTGAVLACGGNVLSRRFEPGDAAAIEFEFVRATCVEMYSVLIAAGLELSAEAHLTMASLCQCTRETLEATAGDPVRVLLSIRKAAAAADRKAGARTPPQAA
jgi:hypothetical protein